MTMKSPFPGMDPYLEQHWRDVHTRLVMYGADQIQEQLPPELSARVEEGVLVDADTHSRNISPDIYIAQRSEAGAAVASPESVIAEPMMIAVDEPVTGRHIEIIDLTSGNRLITAIEILSPSNKADDGRAEYRRKQAEYIHAGVNLVEIDLLRDGMFTLAVPLERIHPKLRVPYMACVRRVTNPTEAELYRFALAQKLLAIPVPLRPTDRDVRLDLQQLIEQCYQRGRYGSINYQEEAIPPLIGDDKAWADRLLREAGKRK